MHSSAKCLWILIKELHCVVRIQHSHYILSCCHTWLLILTRVVKVIWSAFSFKWKSERQQKSSSITAWCVIKLIRRSTYSAKALLLVLLFGGIVGKNSVLGIKAEAELGGDSGWLSEKLRGRWLVICWDWVLAGSAENDSTWLPNRWCERWEYKARSILSMSHCSHAE